MYAIHCLCRELFSDFYLAANNVNGNHQLRNLITLHIRVTLLSDVFATAGYAHGRAAVNLLQMLMANTSPQVIADLGALHRASIWENILLKKGLVAKGIDIASTPAVSPRDGNGNTIPAPPADNGDEVTPPVESASADVQNEEETPLPNPPTTRPPSVRDQNAAVVKHLTHGLPGSLAPFFQGQLIAKNTGKRN